MVTSPRGDDDPGLRPGDGPGPARPAESGRSASPEAFAEGGRADESREPGAVTRLLSTYEARAGLPLGELLAMTIDELRALARAYLSHERGHHTLQPTALVNEAFIRLAGQDGERFRWRNRRQMFRYLSKLMRHILVDHARARACEKRGGSAETLPLEAIRDEMLGISIDNDGILTLEEALRTLAGEDPEMVAVVNLRLFVGLNHDQVAENLGCSRSTAKRRWFTAKRQLFRMLTTGGGRPRERTAGALVDPEEVRGVLARPVVDLTRPGRPILTPGTSFCGMNIRRLVARGGTSEVYEAVDPAEQGPLALKVLRPVGKVIDRALGRSFLGLPEHEGLIRVFRVDETPEGFTYILMEYVDGRELLRHCDRIERPIRERLNLFTKICDAVATMHSSGLLHCDLKSSNVLVTRSAGSYVPKLIDFGSVRPTQSRIRTIVGTPPYMSPEQGEPESRLDERTDIYSLGVMLAEMFGELHSESYGSSEDQDGSDREWTVGAPDGDGRRRRVPPAGMREPVEPGSRPGREEPDEAFRQDLSALVVEATQPDRDRRIPCIDELLGRVDRLALDHLPS